jgi:hypothetical protein
MALAKLSGAIVSIRGRFGGVYFKAGPDGQHVQAWPRIRKYVRSPAQEGAWEHMSPFLGFGIKGFTGSAALWMAACVAFFGAAWAAYALVTLFMASGKEPKKISGYNWFIHYALAFPEAERPPFWKPPHAPGDLPHYISVYQGRYTYETSPDGWSDDCASAYYWPGMMWNGKRSYRDDDFNWFLWWDGADWICSPSLDFKPPNKTFVSTTGDIRGYYQCAATLKYTHVYYGKPPD